MIKITEGLDSTTKECQLEIFQVSFAKGHFLRIVVRGFLL